MHDLVDTMFTPLLMWLTTLYSRIHELSVPLARPINLSNYLGYFNMLGPVWTSCISTIVALSVLYLMVYVVVANMGAIQKFINLIKFW